MTNAQRIRRYEAIRKRYENAFKAPVKRALKTQISSFTSVLRAQGPNAVASVVIIDGDLAKVIQTLYTQTGLAGANETLSYLRSLPKTQAKRRTFGFNQEWTDQIVKYFEINLFNKVVLPISQTTREYILQVISKGAAEGWSIDEMVQQIEREDYLDGRVQRILRTEINRAINFGNTLAEPKFEYKTQKEWSAVHDNRTRHPHLAADGQRVMIDGKFVVGGELLDFPGDPKGSPENTINCRCVTLIMAQRDDKGRLIPKQPAKPLPRVRGRLRAELQNILAELQS
jgi:uncharacterized protein with gpF-like domain